MIKKIVGSLFIGIIATLALMQSDPWVHYQMGELYKYEFGQMYDCVVEGELSSIELLINPHMEFKNFTVKDKSGSWQWQAEKYSSGFSWLALGTFGIIDLWVQLHNGRINTQITESGMAIQDHLQKLAKGSQLVLPMVLRSIDFEAMEVTLQGLTIESSFSWNGQTRNVAHCFKTDVDLIDGWFRCAEKTIIERCAGTLSLDVESLKQEFVDLKLDTQFDMPQLPIKRCLFSGILHKDGGTFSMNAVDRSLLIHPLVITMRDNKIWAQLSATMPLDYVRTLCEGSYSLPFQVGGVAQIKLEGSLDQQFLDGKCAIEDATLSFVPYKQQIESSIHKRGDQWHGLMQASVAPQVALQGSWEWDDTMRNGTLFVHNTHTIPLPSAYTYVLPQDLNVSMNVKNGEVNGLYGCHVSHSLKNDRYKAEGSFLYNKDACFTSHGAMSSYTYSCMINSLFPYLQSCIVENDSLKYVEITSQGTGIDASIDFQAFRSIVQALTGFDLQGEGKIALQAAYEKDLLSAQLQLVGGTIRLPHTYNFTDTMQARITADIAKKEIQAHDVMIGMHTGTVVCRKARLVFDDKANLLFSHIPLCFDRCLFNFKQDLFAMISGSILLSHMKDTTPSIKGHIFFERSQLKENIFSPAFQKKLFAMAHLAPDVKTVDLDYDLVVETKDWITIDTDFLKASAQASLHCKGSVQEPSISGSISLASGTLNFPYKPLNIHRGTMVFNEKHPFNPTIELIAKNIIKKHRITLQVTGTLLNNFVILESAPPLTEEQIVSLLIAGAHEESLSALVPTLLMHNITNLIFSADQSGVFNQYMRPWMKQFNVQFLPSLTNHGARGGLRGSLEITIDDRWRALIQKNFSLTEDTRFELEYILSDDVSFRVIRDERCDIGGEVEMKWKF